MLRSPAPSKAPHTPRSGRPGSMGLGHGLWDAGKMWVPGASQDCRVGVRGGFQVGEARVALPDTLGLAVGGTRMGPC